MQNDEIRFGPFRLDLDRTSLPGAPTLSPRPKSQCYLGPKSLRVILEKLEFAVGG
jgi:hypothetical protein